MVNDQKQPYQLFHFLMHPKVFPTKKKSYLFILFMYKMFVRLYLFYILLLICSLDYLSNELEDNT